MRIQLAIDLAPPWVLVIFFLSLCEAIGLTIYFHADIIDPEVASMQPAYLQARGLDPMMTPEPNNKIRHPGKRRDDRKSESHDVMQAQGSSRRGQTTGTSMGRVRSL